MCSAFFADKMDALLFLKVVSLLLLQTQAQGNALDNEVPDEIWKMNEQLINEYNQPKPNFFTKGVRISEAKCLEYIWDVEQQDKNNKMLAEYRKNSNFVTVTGGRESKPSEFPHMGALGWKGKKGNWVFLCGSFLISDEFLLTAAHCHKAPLNQKTVEPKSEAKIVRLGVDNIKKDELQPIDMKISKFIRHPKYKGPSYKYFDIALIRLREKVIFTKTVRPLCIRNQFVVDKAIITGWGVIDKGIAKQASDDLRVAHVDIVDPGDCEARLRQKKSMKWNEVRDQICAVDKNGKAGTCNGDSGGPLQVKLQTNSETPVYNAIAVTSFGFVCGTSVFPSIYTNITSFIEWIEQIVWKDEIIKQRGNKISDKTIENDNVKIININDQKYEVNVEYNLVNNFAKLMSTERPDEIQNTNKVENTMFNTNVPKSTFDYLKNHPIFRHNFV